MSDVVQYVEGVGRRKTSTARARLYAGGSGKVLVNDKEISTYFSRSEDIAAVSAPLLATGANARYNVSVHVNGGGVTGQAIASRLAVSRALLLVDAEYRAALKTAGFLTRDPREKERKKPGLKRARKAPTYTKR
ncbi:MAG: 30S ribosomal protein S9 [Anaerolineae bacterium]|nr:30S ribosomal protein S9 [Anaerolineae bacterium]